MAVQRRMDQLQAEVAVLGLEGEIARRFSHVRKVGKRELTEVLHDHFLPEGGLPYPERQELMLCKKIEDLSEEEQKTVVCDGSKYLASEKLNGVRMRLVYIRGKGWFATSRNISVATYRNEEYTGYLKFCDVELTISYDFLELDCEAICYDSVDTAAIRKNRGVVTETSLHNTSALFAIEVEDSLKLQETATIYFKVFDILSMNHNDYVRDRTPLNARLAILEDVVKNIQKDIPQIVYVEHFSSQKQKVFDMIVADGGEGLVLKEKHGHYEASSSRSKSWIKWKKETDPIDAFVDGYELADPKSGWAGLVGALHMYVFVYRKDGSYFKHWIASITNIPLEERKEITVQGVSGPELRNDYYGKVARVVGQEISVRAKRLVHPRSLGWRIGPDAKPASQCVIGWKESTKLGLI